MNRIQQSIQRVCSRCLALVAVAILLIQTHNAQAAKNVILMIADGSGHNIWSAASMYQGKLGKQVYDQPGWVRLSCSTYPLTLSSKPTGNKNNKKQTSSLVYDPALAWGVDLHGTTSFPGYDFLTSTYTDSAASGTALSTGRKTYNQAINWSNDDRPMRGQTIAEIAKSQGKSVGVVTSVPWSHATPAALGGAHNVDRDNYVEIAKEMLGAPWLDVIMGAGNPDFDHDGRPIPGNVKRTADSVGGLDTWQALKAGKLPWKLIESKADFEALVSGSTPSKVLGTAQVASTLQRMRGRGGAIIPHANTPAAAAVGTAASVKTSASVGEAVELPPQPFAVPFNSNVPSLATMAKGAINCLDDNPDGFFLMIEGGAVDWANHANEPDCAIEEQIDFVNAVEAVVAWVESHGGWDDTLLILTADHETGLLWGPNSSKRAFQPLVDHGPGKLPGLRYNAHSHSNSLVPLYARGPGSPQFSTLVRGEDPTAAVQWRYSGKYVDNTDIFAVMQAEMMKKNDSSSKR